MAVLGFAAAFSLPSASAQEIGMGMFGFGGWGMNIANNPMGGYMQGLGQYNLNSAQGMEALARARSVNTDTAIRWNKALREEQARRKAEADKQAAIDRADRIRRDEIGDLENGNTLNSLMNQIHEFPNTQARSMLGGAAISANAIRIIPFEVASEGITFSLDELASDRYLPPGLQSERFNPEKQALRDAVRKAKQEDIAGEISETAVLAVQDAVRAFHDKLDRVMLPTNPLYQDSDQYLRSLAILAQLIERTEFQGMLRKLGDKTEVSIGQLVAFMNSYNLRFGPATTDEQKQLYRRLQPILADAAKASEPVALPAAPPLPLHEVARNTFKDLSWKDIEALIAEKAQTDPPK
jgi:hypothetical protein